MKPVCKDELTTFPQRMPMVSELSWVFLSAAMVNFLVRSAGMITSLRLPAPPPNNPMLMKWSIGFVLRSTDGIGGEYGGGGTDGKDEEFDG